MENTEAKAMQTRAGELERRQRQVVERLQTAKSEYLEIKESLRYVAHLDEPRVD